MKPNLYEHRKKTKHKTSYNHLQTKVIRYASIYKGDLGVLSHKLLKMKWPISTTNRQNMKTTLSAHLNEIPKRRHIKGTENGSRYELEVEPSQKNAPSNLYFIYIERRQVIKNSKLLFYTAILKYFNTESVNSCWHV